MSLKSKVEDSVKEMLFSGGYHRINQGFLVPKLAVKHNADFNPDGSRSQCSIRNHISCIVSTMIKNSKKAGYSTILMVKDGYGYRSLSYDKMYSEADQTAAHKRLVEEMSSHKQTSIANGIWDKNAEKLANGYLQLHVTEFNKKFRKTG